MPGEQSTSQDAETLTEEQAKRMLVGMNEAIRAGEEMRKLRAEMISLFADLGWTQETIARLTEVSQPAVSKQVTKRRPDAPVPPMDLSLDQYDVPWLEGRLWALAEEVSEALDDTARCTSYLNAITRGKKRLTPQNVDELRRLLEADLRQHRTAIPGSYQNAYDEISRGLDIPLNVETTGSASMRRALARQIQRDRFKDDGA